jgi:hypothetical protein
MRKSLAFALAATLAAAGSLHAQPAPASWVERSNADAKVLLDTIARISPEFATEVGLGGYDTRVADLKPGVDERSRAALVEAKGRLQEMLATEKDPNVREDLKIMIEATARQIEGIDLNRKYLLPYNDIGSLVFSGEFALLKDDVDAGRRPAALERLECYVGKAPGCTPITEQAKALTTARLGDKSLLGPYKGEVEQKLANTPRYVEGIRKLFAKYKLDTPVGRAALEALDGQLKD